MDEISLLINRALFGSLAFIMFGLGLSLKTVDFTRLFSQPKAVGVALGLQVIVLPLACVSLIFIFNVPGVFAIGLMLLAASPGGISANLFSHLYGGNVAMNISLTALNTLLSIITLPLIANWAITYFSSTGQVVPVQTGKLIEVISIILIPVFIGMFVAKYFPIVSVTLEKPVKLFSAFVLASVATLSFVKEWGTISSNFVSLGTPILLFNLISLLSGYYVSRWVGLNKPLATAISYEIGIHNSTLAMYIAMAVLGSYEQAVPAAIYSVMMYITAPLFGSFVLNRYQSLKTQQSE